ncbi:DNA polymerase III subunit gamma/tau [Shewanella surugensis]|uniref:DNA-directed DNA polymerase n=1 Tax=Shewanella surugensis TaxID=212020 RepID=A0ABT0LCE9_9GAMM|nr:DNA polymerase III subunit gamma/tau [Shewanella surugensis]MCL1125381.1 DNA polymerase III subunit gamma/tau [Shewanella surugensis]
MSYQVLARKWRPAKFEQVVGQSHVLHALTNALTQQRLHHAYLFSGTRGVGKTSLARLFAKGLNCEQGVTAEPCGVCGSCVEIAQGRFVDLIEVDAASRTKVDDTRELLDNVQYRPSRGRYKVYLIDEVHMLSRSSFNALLKTLEEPPEHVKFLLATTDPQKLPITVLSRCLQFNLKSIAHADIVTQLTHILTEESLAFEEQALTLIAKSANGSMRDALSLTDQAIAFGAGQVMLSQVQTMLGSIDEHHVINLLSALISGDIAQVMQVTHDVLSFGADADEVLRGLLELLHQITLTQFAPAAAQLSLNSDKILTFSNELNAEQVQLYYQVLLTGRKDLTHAPDPKSGLEMALLRAVTFVPDSPITRWEGSQDSSKADKPSVLERRTDPRDTASKGIGSNGISSKNISPKEASSQDVNSNEVSLKDVSIFPPEVMSVQELGSNLRGPQLNGDVKDLLSLETDSSLEDDTAHTEDALEAMPADLHAEMALIVSQAQSQGADFDLIPIEAIQESIQETSAEDIQAFSDVDSLEAINSPELINYPEPIKSADYIESEQAHLHAEVREIIQEQAQEDSLVSSLPSSAMKMTGVGSPERHVEQPALSETRPIIGDDILDAVLAARESLLASSEKEKAAKETGKKPNLARTIPQKKSGRKRELEASEALTKAQDVGMSSSREASMAGTHLVTAPSVAVEMASVDIHHIESSNGQDLGMTTCLQRSDDRPPWESPTVDELKSPAQSSPMIVPSQVSDASGSSEPVPSSVVIQEPRQAIPIEVARMATPLSGDRRDLLWYKFMALLDVGGRVRQLAVNSVCHQFSTLIHLQLKPDQKHLCADVAITQLEEAIAKILGCRVPLSVEIGIDPTRETPLEVRKRFHQELLNDAQQDLIYDENIQWLINNMQAQLQLDTLAYSPPLLTEKSNSIELLTLENFDKLSVA